MSKFQIHTTLTLKPDRQPPKKPESISPYVTIFKGDIAKFTFSLKQKIYGFNELDQVTFKFKGQTQTKTYKLFQYFKLSTDKAAVVDKNYFIRSFSDSSLSNYSFTKLNIKTGQLLPNYCYEEYFPTSIDNVSDWQMNPLFSYNARYSEIILILDSLETNTFEIALFEDAMDLTVEVELGNEPLLPQYSNKTLVEMQQYVIVKQAIRPEPVVDHPVASETSFCSETLYCNE